MKKRNGFVSNSSSSSFLIYGVYNPDIPEDLMEFVNKDFIKEAWEVWYQEVLKNDFAKKNPDKYPTDIPFESWLKIKKDTNEGWFESFVLNEVLELVGIEHYDPFDYEDHYFGICPTNMGEDETMGEFKKRVDTLLENVFGSVSSGWQEYAWRDG